MTSLPRAYFEEVYGANDDPWGFETSPYEAAKYDATLAALPRPRYRSGYEVGCSLGVLTERLAGRCDRLLAVDTIAGVLERARARCRRHPHVAFRQAHLPADAPDETFDLVVLSEVGYYLAMDALTTLRGDVVAALEPGGHLILVHWTPPVHDYPLTGDEVHEAFLAVAGSGGPLRHLNGRREETYRLDVLERTADPPAEPPAERT